MGKNMNKIGYRFTLYNNFNIFILIKPLKEFSINKKANLMRKISFNVN
jgi:hypothetical protein